MYLHVQLLTSFQQVSLYSSISYHIWVGVCTMYIFMGRTDSYQAHVSATTCILVALNAQECFNNIG